MQTISNCMTVLRHDPMLQNAIRYNILTDREDIVGSLGWKRSGTALTDTDMNYLLLYFEEKWYKDLKDKNGDRWHDTGFLFVKENGEPMIPDGITAWLSEFSKRHDLPHINPHAFRHTMASILINSGKDVVSVSKRLGHAKVSTTTDIYSHIIMEADEQASECLADVMLRPTKKKAAM